MLPHLKFFLSGLTSSILLVCTVGVFAQEPPDVPTNYDVVTRGPVHEAFAQPVDLRPEAGPAVAKAPPAPVEEIPPDQRPDGDDIEWISGYWAWDSEASEHLWISGFWRDAPPGRRWVPGTWQEAEDGWHWTPGFWAPEEAESIVYTPPPPETLDAGPTIPAPTETHVWIPGNWMWRDARFYWRPGFWCAYRADWAWCPPRYCWTPGGCVFVDGYWDRPCHLRGLLFAPVRFPSATLVVGFRYTPYHVVRADFLLTSLFVGPARRHYYFGDYFHDRYVTGGYVPWIDYQPVRGVYDPTFGYYQSTYLRHPEWSRNLTAVYRGRLRGDIPRPPTTLVQQQTVINTITNNKTSNVNIGRDLNITNIQNVTVVDSIKRINNTETTGLASLASPKAKGDVLAPKRTFKLRDLDKDQRLLNQQRVEDARTISKQRRDTEAKLLADGGVTAKGKPVTMELPKDKTKTDPTKKGTPARTRTKSPDLPTIPQTIDREPPKEVKPPPQVRPPARKKDAPPPTKKVDPPTKQKSDGVGFPLPPKKKDVTPPPKKVDPPPPAPKVTPPPKEPPPKTPPPKSPPKKKKDGDID